MKRGKKGDFQFSNWSDVFLFLLLFFYMLALAATEKYQNCQVRKSMLPTLILSDVSQLEAMSIIS